MSQNVITATQREIVYYACGGTGINLTRRYRENAQLESGISAKERFAYVDTSIANLHNVQADEVFKLEGVDGSGKDRSRNAAAVKQNLPSIMLQHQPGDMNVVIFSAAGGTGSVAGPLLLEELLKNGHSATAIVVGAHDSLKTTINTINTLQGLEMTAKRVGRPVVIAYRENERGKSLSENDIDHQFRMAALSILSSGLNGHLDKADVENLFDYHKVTHHQPGLAVLDIYAREEDLTANHDHVIALACLFNSEDQVAPVISMDYDTVGYLPAVNARQTNFYYAISNDSLKGIVERLNDLRKQADMQKKVVTNAPTLLDSKVEVDETGLIL